MSRPAALAGLAGRMVSLSEAAQALDVERQVLRRAITKGQITGYRIGSRTIRLDGDELARVYGKPMHASGERRA